MKTGIKFKSFRVNFLFLLTSLFFLIPVFSIIYLSLNSVENVWTHLLETVFFVYLKNSLLLTGGVGVLAFVFGVGSAWFIACCDFPSKKILSWALLLPFAFPAYIIFYIYTDLLEFSGVVQIFIRNFMGYESKADYWFPEIRSLPGAIILFALVLYPYVYLIARKAFLEQSQSLIETAEMLGLSRLKIFYRISLPLARPAIIVGVILVVMETLNEFGAVEFFSISTLSLGIYNVWINMSNLGGASQIGLFTLIIVMLIIALERAQRKKQKQLQTENSIKKTIPLKGVKMVLVLLFSWALVGFGFLIPLLTLFTHSFKSYSTLGFSELFDLIQNSFLLSVLASFITITLGLFIIFQMRFNQTFMIRLFSKLYYFNYAIPGVIMAIGIMVPFNQVLIKFVDFWEETLGFSSNLFIFSSLIILLLAYSFRFISISIGSFDSTLKKVSYNLDASASLLGLKNFNIFMKLHFPLLKKAIFTAFLIIFVDTMKELPMTLILRPFNFDTLATTVYSFASNELIEDAALPSLFIVLIGVLPTIILNKNIN